MAASRWPWRLRLVARIRRSTSDTVRCFRVRKSRLGARLGVTVRFMTAGATSFKCAFAMISALPPDRLFVDEPLGISTSSAQAEPAQGIPIGTNSTARVAPHLDVKYGWGRSQERRSMSVRNDHELPRSQADASDDAHTWTDQGPFEVQEAIKSIGGHFHDCCLACSYFCCTIGLPASHFLLKTLAADAVAVRSNIPLRLFVALHRTTDSLVECGV